MVPFVTKRKSKIRKVGLIMGISGVQGNQFSKHLQQAQAQQAYASQAHIQESKPSTTKPSNQQVAKASAHVQAPKASAVTHAPAQVTPKEKTSNIQHNTPSIKTSKPIVQTSTYNHKAQMTSQSQPLGQKINVAV